MNLAELERLAREATPGPWEAYTDCPGECCWLIRQPEQDDAITEGITWPETSKEDAAYIAAFSPEVVLRLVAIARAAEKMLPAMAECQEIARRWEPDDSSGKERQWLVRGKDAAAALREALSPEKERTNATD